MNVNSDDRKDLNTYGWNAKDYEENSSAQQKWASELIGKLMLTGTEDILDLGCGNGNITAELASRVVNGTVTGVDNSHTMIAHAQECYPASNYPNLSFGVADARSLMFQDQFDVVFSNAALHWVKEHAPVVEGLYRCLRQGGRILLQMGGEGNARDILSVLGDIMSSPEWRECFVGFEFPYGFLGVTAYEKLLFAAGFKVNRVELIPKIMEHNGKAGLAGWIRTTWLPYIERIPEGKRDRFVDEISTNYIRKVPLSSTGVVQVAMTRIEVAAEKV